MNEGNKNICFLFGSGADTCYSKRLKSGSEFAESLLCAKYSDERKQMLGKEIGRFSLIHHQSMKVFIQSIINNKNEAQKCFDQKTIDLCERYYEENETDPGLKTLCSEWYKSLTKSNSSPEYTRAKERDFFLKHAVFFDSLDEKFNSLRNITRNNKAKRVINAYATIFILMVYDLYRIPENFEWNFANIFDLLNEDYDIAGPCNENSYYHILANSRIKAHIATTNYTKIAQNILDLDDTAYLHGKLTWFENLADLTVYDCEVPMERKEAEENISSGALIPFILIPSGVKPIICTKQIKEFYKFITYLEDSSLLCIVGYRFNSEDNHINSIIADWLRDRADREIVYLNYKGSVGFDNLTWAKTFERKTLTFEMLDSKDSFSGAQIYIINTDDENSTDAFSRIIKHMEKLS